MICKRCWIMKAHSTSQIPPYCWHLPVNNVLLLLNADKISMSIHRGQKAFVIMSTLHHNPFHCQHRPGSHQRLHVPNHAAPIKKRRLCAWALQAQSLDGTCVQIIHKLCVRCLVSAAQAVHLLCGKDCKTLELHILEPRHIYLCKVLHPARV